MYESFLSPDRTRSEGQAPLRTDAVPKGSQESTGEVGDPRKSNCSTYHPGSSCNSITWTVMEMQILSPRSGGAKSETDGWIQQPVF